MKKNNNNKYIDFVTYVFLFIFALCVIWLLYLNIFRAKDISNSNYNKRIDSWSRYVYRGEIYDRNNNILAKTYVDTEHNEIRQYPYNNIFFHIVGYTGNGKSGIELAYNYYLLSSEENELTNVINALQNTKSSGYDVVTTLDVEMGKVASEAMGDSKGAVVVLDAGTGEVLCEISKPDFDSNSIDSEWENIVNDPDNTTLLNRALFGLYPPGSTFKLVTLIEYIEENPNNYDEFEYLCRGTMNYGGSLMSCIYKSAHGNVNLNRAFAYSCNCAFATMGLELNIDKYSKLCDTLMFNSELYTAFETGKSTFSLTKNSSDFDVMQTAIGQGKTLITPMHNAMIMSAVANDGILMKPYVVSQIKNGEKTVRTFRYDSKRLLSKSVCEKVKEYLADVVDYGTATNLKNGSYMVYGKTGSAQFDDKNPAAYHSWFNGFANINGRNIVVCAVVENTYDGGNTGKNVAEKILNFCNSHLD